MRKSEWEYEQWQNKFFADWFDKQIAKILETAKPIIVVPYKNKWSRAGFINRRLKKKNG